MQNHVMSTYHERRVGFAPHATQTRAPDVPRGHSDRQFVAMLDAYRASGGIARAYELLGVFSRRQGPDISTLARWIVERDVVCFEWQSHSWLPLFQFDRNQMQPLATLHPLFAELTCVYDAWEMGVWFAQPNPWLAEQAPVDALPVDFPAVLNAARADRFVARG